MTLPEDMPSPLSGGDEEARRIYEALVTAVEDLGEVDVRVGESQVGFRRKRSFAAVWRPGRYLRGSVPPLVVSIYLQRRDPSPRWKQVVEPAEGRFTHHLELRRETDVDDQVIAWLREAWSAAA